MAVFRWSDSDEWYPVWKPDPDGDARDLPGVTDEEVARYVALYPEFLALLDKIGQGFDRYYRGSGRTR